MSIAVVDVGDAKALRAIFRTGQRAFLLNPPAPVSGDKDTEERRTASAIVEALDGSGLEKVVAQSTFGAQAGRRKGDLSVLYEFEGALQAQPIPVTIQRGAYYMSNWASMVDAARQGILPSMFPSDFPLPMVAPAGLGREAASLLRQGPEHTGTIHIEGPERYKPRDVAHAFAASLGRSVDVAVTPRKGMGGHLPEAWLFQGGGAVLCRHDGCDARRRNGQATEYDAWADNLAEYVDNLVAQTKTN